jgi:hypothetical protein
MTIDVSLDYPSFKVDREAPHNILTWTGRSVDPWDMKPEDVVLDDIAHALALQCRYAGHVPTHYSVAEHSYRGAQQLRDDGASKAVQKAFLLHDAAEAYLIDLPRPIKNRPEFDAYRAAEARLEKVIGKRFKVDLFNPLHAPVVKSMDYAMYQWEVRRIRSGQEHGLPPAQAEDMFRTWALRLGVK